MTAPEVPLAGGRDTAGVVRVGDTVRRPQRARSPFVHELLLHLERVGFDAAPRFLGVDAAGREILSFVPGEVPPDLDASLPDDVLAAAARLIRRYHDAVAGSPLASGDEVVCHNDLSPCNFAFRDGVPCGIFDFDGAGPGPRARDIAYATFLWLNVGTDGPPPAEQARRIGVFCDAYGIEPPAEELVTRMRALTAAKADDRREGPGGWWRAQHEWLRVHGADLTRACRREAAGAG